MKKFILLGILTAALAPMARAQILTSSTFNLTADLDLNQKVYFDFETLSASVANSNPYGSAVDLAIQSFLGEPEFPMVRPVGSGWRVVVDSSESPRVRRFSYSESIPTSPTDTSSIMADGGTAPWDGDTGATVSYMALVSPDNKLAWIGVKFNDAENTVTLAQFAIADPGVPLQAGVPEPAETALAMAALSGGFAVWRRRRARALAQAS